MARVAAVDCKDMLKAGFWQVRLRKGRAWHFVAIKSDGTPVSITFCRKDSGDRVQAHAGRELTGPFCLACLESLGKMHKACQAFARATGLPEGEAIAMADEILKLTRTKNYASRASAHSIAPRAR